MLGKVLHNVYQGGLSSQLCQKTIGCRFLSPTAIHVQNQISERNKTHFRSCSLGNVNKSEEDSNSLHFNVEQLKHVQQSSSQNNSNKNVTEESKNIFLSNECKTSDTNEKGNKTRNPCIIGTPINVNLWNKSCIVKQISPFSIGTLNRNFSQIKGDGEKSSKKENQNKQSNNEKLSAEDICNKENTIQILKIKESRTSTKGVDKKQSSSSTLKKNIKFHHAFHPSTPLTNKTEKTKDKLAQAISSHKSNDFSRGCMTEVKSEMNLKASLNAIPSKSDIKIAYSTSCDDSSSKNKCKPVKAKKNKEAKCKAPPKKGCIKKPKKAKPVATCVQKPKPKPKPVCDCRKICDALEIKKTDDCCVEKKEKLSDCCIPKQNVCEKKVSCVPRRSKAKSCKVKCNKKKKKPSPLNIGCKSNLEKLCLKIREFRESRRKCNRKKRVKDVCKKRTKQVRGVCKKRPRKVKSICKPKKVNVCKKKTKKVCVNPCLKKKDPCVKKKDPCLKKKDPCLKKKKKTCRDICDGDGSKEGSCRDVCDETKKKDICGTEKKPVCKKRKVCQKPKKKRCGKTSCRKSSALHCRQKNRTMLLCRWLQRKYRMRAKKKQNQLKIGNCSAFRRFMSRRRRR